MRLPATASSGMLSYKKGFAALAIRRQGTIIKRTRGFADLGNATNAITHSTHKRCRNEKKSVRMESALSQVQARTAPPFCPVGSRTSDSSVDR